MPSNLDQAMPKNTPAPNDHFASVNSVDVPVETDVKTGNKRRLLSVDDLSPVQTTLSVQAIPIMYAQKVSAMHEALISFEKTLAAVATSDEGLRRGFLAAHTAVVEVLKG